MNEATKQKAEQGIHDAFVISVIAKGLFAFVQIVLGIMLLFIGQTTAIIDKLAQSELLEDPGDFLANWTQSILHPTQEAQVFGGLYLLSHGVVKILLVAGLLRNRLWAYPASMGVFTIFIIYQLFRYFFRTHSPWLLGITVVDIVIIWLIYHEYRQVLKRVTIE
jgi:uncharacterized membrane protein